MEEIIKKIELIRIDLQSIKQSIKIKNLIFFFIFTIIISFQFYFIFFSNLKINIGINTDLLNCSSEKDYLDCINFKAQEEAQFVLNFCKNDPNNLDPDKNGIACDELPKFTEIIKKYL